MGNVENRWVERCYFGFTLKCSHGPHQQPPGLEPANPVKAGDKATQSFSDSKHRPSDQFDSFDWITSVSVHISSDIYPDILLYP